LRPQQKILWWKHAQDFFWFFPSSATDEPMEVPPLAALAAEWCGQLTIYL
jgi:hypothetical protein